MYRVTIRSLHAGEAQPDVAELQPAPGQRAGPLLRVQPRRLHRHAALPRLRARAERQPPTGFPMFDGSLMLVCCYVQKEQGGGSSPGRSRGYRPPSVWPRASSSCTEASCPASSATTSRSPTSSSTRTSSPRSAATIETAESEVLLLIGAASLNLGRGKSD
jgi:hypothetical protein